MMVKEVTAQVLDDANGIITDPDFMINTTKEYVDLEPNPGAVNNVQDIFPLADLESLYGLKATHPNLTFEGSMPLAVEMDIGDEDGVVPAYLNLPNIVTDPGPPEVYGQGKWTDLIPHLSIETGRGFTNGNHIKTSNDNLKVTAIVQVDIDQMIALKADSANFTITHLLAFKTGPLVDTGATGYGV